MQTIKVKYERIMEILFKILFLSLALATFNGFLYVSPLQPVLVKITLVSAVAVMLIRVINYRKYMKMPGIILMILFCVSFAVSSFMNRQYDFAGNLKWIIWTGILFFALYVCDLERDTAEYRKEFRIISHIIIAYTVFSSLAGIIMMVTSFSKILETTDGEAVIAGFTWGRLWGVYTDPNYGAVLSVIAIVLSLLFLIQKKGVIRIIYGVSILLNYLYIVFSDSRTGKVTLVFSLGLFIFLWIRDRQKEKTFGKRYCIAALIAVFISILALAGSYWVKTEYNRTLASVCAELFSEKKTQQTQQTQQSQSVKNEIGRKDDLKEDVSNGRLALWESAIEIWKTSPVYGTGYTSLVPYMEENIPDTYAINNPQTRYTSMHNAFLNTLVFQGLVGFVLLLLIAGRIIVYSVPEIFKEQGDESLNLAAMLSCIGAVVVSMMFLLEGTYTNSPGSFVLWVFSGYLVQTAYTKRVEDRK